MEEKEEYVAMFNWTYQVGPDQWETSTLTKKIDDNTTIGEIKEWALQKIRPSKNMIGFKVSPLD